MRFGKLGLRQRFLVLGVGVATPAALAIGLVLPSAAHAKVSPAPTPVRPVSCSGTRRSVMA